MFKVYILYSESIDSYYIGYTNSIERRLSEHNRKKGKFTDAGIPWKLVYSEIFDNKKEAMLREQFIKAKKSRVYINDLIKSC